MFFYEKFQYSETKKIRQEYDSLSLKKTFRNRKFLKPLKCSSTKCFGTVRRETIRRKIVITHHPLLSIKNFRHRNFFKHWNVRLRNPWHCDLKKLIKLVITHLFLKDFQNQKFFKTRKGFSTNGFGIVSQKSFDTKAIASLIEKILHI